MPKQYKIAITVGCFDLLHTGHLNLFNKMREYADKVIVLLHSNRSIFENKGKFPVQNYDDRQCNLMDSNLVDSVVAVDFTDPTYQLKNVFDRIGTKDMVYMRGDDWLDFPGRLAVEEAGVPIEIIPYTKDISSTIIKNKLCS